VLVTGEVVIIVRIEENNATEDETFDTDVAVIGVVEEDVVVGENVVFVKDVMTVVDVDVEVDKLMVVGVVEVEVRVGVEV